MQSLDEVLTQLRRVRSLRFNSQSKAGTGWEGVGIGTVEVIDQHSGVVVFNETGTWQPSAPDRKTLCFKNVFRWSATCEMQRLEHLRFGPENPVLLFDMAPGEDGVWREVNEHQCGEDCYTASLDVIEGQIVMAWIIVGPCKQESIRYIYW